MITALQKDSLQVEVYSNRAEMGQEAEKQVSAVIRRLLAEKEEIHMIFAAAPSQNEFLSALAADQEIDFSRVNAYHMDDYIGLEADAPQGFANFLRRALFDRRQFKSVNLLNGQSPDPQAECDRYSALLRAVQMDIVCLGIGENGHIAFNDPPVADFEDPALVKVVAMDQICRQQQVNDGCFQQIDQVPTHAFTLTVPALVNAAYHFCMVPSQAKAQAVYDTVNGPVSTACPASILHRCPNAILYLDPDSSSLL